MRGLTPRSYSRCGLLPLAAAIAACVGCGNGLASLSGKVTLDGQPLAAGGDTRATVYLYPEGGTGAPAVGLLDESGEFTVSTGSQTGVVPGTYVVTVSASTLIRKNSTPGMPPSARRVTPNKYANPNASGLRLQIEPGYNECEFALESDPADRRRRRS